MIGQDPADPSRALVRKIVQVSPKTYCLEEVRITPVEGKRPTVHTQIFRLGALDLKENLTPEEIQIRGAYRPLPNVLGFSLYSRDTKSTLGYHYMSIVENSLYKASGSTWAEWFRDLRDKRDMASYL